MADILPDSRTQDLKGSTYSQRYGNEIPTFCANCHIVRGPDIPEENILNFFWLCNNCFEKWGPIAATMTVPDEALVREQIEEIKEKPNAVRLYDCFGHR